MQDRALKNEKIDVKWNVKISEILGDGKKVTGVRLASTVDEATEDFSCDGVFLAIGHVPNTKFLEGKVDLDEKGYLKCDRYMHTNLPGIFAAGDVQDLRYRQAITAAGSGCQAALEVEHYLANHE